MRSRGITTSHIARNDTKQKRVQRNGHENETDNEDEREARSCSIIIVIDFLNIVIREEVSCVIYFFSVLFESSLFHCLDRSSIASIHLGEIVVVMTGASKMSEVRVPTRTTAAAAAEATNTASGHGLGGGGGASQAVDVKRQKERALALIKKHGGKFGHEATRTDWVVALISNIDKAYWKLGEKSSAASAKRSKQEAETNEQMSAAVSEIKTLRAELEELRAERDSFAEQRRLAESHVVELRHRLITAEELSSQAVAEMESLRDRLGQDRLRDLKLRGKSGAKVKELKEQLQKAKTDVRGHRSLIRSRDLALESMVLEQQQHLAKRAALERQMEKLSSTRERDKVIYDSELTNLKIQLANATVSRAPMLRTSLRARSAR